VSSFPAQGTLPHPSNPDRDVWLQSYDEEKGGLNKLDVYQTINKKTYLQLKRSGKIGKALPLMCVLVIKPNKDGSPHRAKSRIVVLGNHEDRYWSKSQRYAPVLKYSSVCLLCSKAVEAKKVLQQGDCKNAFYVMPNYHLKNLPSLYHRLGILSTATTPTGFSTKHCMACAAVHTTGITCSVLL
jgi:hypothetical protein